MKPPKPQSATVVVVGASRRAREDDVIVRAAVAPDVSRRAPTGRVARLERPTGMHARNVLRCVENGIFLQARKGREDSVTTIDQG